MAVFNITLNSRKFKILSTVDPRNNWTYYTKYILINIVNFLQNY